MEEYKVKTNISFAGMLSRYGFEFRENSGTNLGQHEPITANNQLIILGAPLYLSHSGFMRLQDGFLFDIGVRGSVRGSDAKNDLAYASYLTINMTGIFPTDYSQRWYGFSLR